MPISIYNNSSDKKVVGKTKTLVVTSNYILLEDCSIINPRLKLVYSSSILSANYAYIAEFNRYYFINNITILAGEILLLELSIDVLETYKTQIKALTCIIKRNSITFNKYLDDPLFQAENKRQIQTKSITSTEFAPDALSSSSPCFVLTIAGG